MHELATTQNLVRICEDAAAREGFRRVVEIHLSIGAMTGIIPRALEEFFPYVSKDTVCEGARIVSTVLPVRVACPHCGYEGEAEGYECPRCGGGIRLTQGREFFVDNLAVE